MIKESGIQPFYLYGRLIAVLEQGARAQGQIPWLELYYPRGFLPWVGLREPLRNHLQSVLPFLERRERAEQLPCPASTCTGQRPAKLRRTSTKTRKALTPGAPVTCPTTAAPSPNFPTNPRPGTRRSYAQGYLVERQTLQPQAPTAAKETRTPAAVLLGLPPGPAAHLEHRRQRPWTPARSPARHQRPESRH